VKVAVINRFRDFAICIVALYYVTSAHLSTPGSNEYDALQTVKAHLNNIYQDTRMSVIFTLI